MADGFQANPGVGGAWFQSLRDAGGKQWPVGVSVFATTVAEDANVLSVVTDSNGLPVAQQGAWEVGLSPGQTLAAVTSVTDPVTIVQPTAANLKVLADINAGQSVAVTQATAANLNATVSIASGQTLAGVTTLGSITNAVTVAQPTASSLKATVDISAGQTVAVTQATASSLNATAVLAAGTALVGKVVSGADAGVVYFNGTAVTLKRAKASATASGDTTLVAGVAGKSLYVLRYSLRSNTTSTVKFRSNTTDLSAPFYMCQYAVNNGAPSEFPHYVTAAGEALNVNLGAAGTVSAEVLYFEA